MLYFSTFILLCFLSLFSVSVEANPDILKEIEEYTPLCQDINIYECKTNESDYCYNLYPCRDTCSGLFILPFAEYAIGKTIGIDDDYGHVGLLM